jgi:hypothetical protein
LDAKGAQALVDRLTREGRYVPPAGAILHPAEAAQPPAAAAAALDPLTPLSTERAA